jgi:hypothetical protein
MYVPAPPRILSVFPKGVSMASEATEPTINNLLITSFKKDAANIQFVFKALHAKKLK